MESKVKISAPAETDFERTAADTRWVLFATILASSMAFIDSSALNVTLPAVQAALGANGKELLWIVNVYMLMLSSLLLTGGSLGDRFGRKKIFMVGILIFALSSGAAGLAPSSLVMIIARAIQGVGGALMVPGSLAIISSTVPAQQRGKAIGTWSAFTTITTILGPVLGGTLASAGFWRGVFFINMPIAMLTLAVCAWRVPETKADGGNRLDWLGSIVVTLALAALTYGAIEAPERGLGQPAVLSALIGGALGLILFAVIEATLENPMVPLRLFRIRRFTGANLLTFFLYAALNVSFIFLSLTLIQVQGYRAQQAGFATLPMVALLALLSRWAGGLADRYGSRLLLILGPILAGLGFFGLGLPDLSANAANYWTTYLPPVMLIGIGMGITVAPLTTVVMTALPEDQVGVASGVNNAVARVAGVLAVAIMGGLVLVNFRQALTERAQGLSLEPQQRQALIAQAENLGEASPPESLSPDQTAAAENVINQSLLLTFRRTAFVTAALALLSSMAAVIWIREDDKVNE